MKRNPDLVLPKKIAILWKSERNDYNFRNNEFRKVQNRITGAHCVRNYHRNLIYEKIR